MGDYGSQKKATDPLEESDLLELQLQVIVRSTWCGCWAPNSSSLKAQQTPLTTESPPPPRPQVYLLHGIANATL